MDSALRIQMASRRDHRCPGHFRRGGQEGGQFSHILGGGAREGNCGFLDRKQRPVYAFRRWPTYKTDRDPHEGKVPAGGSRIRHTESLISPMLGANCKFPHRGNQLRQKPPLVKQPAAEVVYGHVVRTGETISTIPRIYGSSVQELKASNNLVNRAMLVHCQPNAGSKRAVGTGG